LLTLGVIVFVAYTAPGFSLFPITLIKKIPALSVGTPSEIQAKLDINHELQRAITGKYATIDSPMNAKDRREIEALRRDERKLRRQKQIAEDSQTAGWWGTVGKVLRPIRVILGLLLLAIAALIWISMLITGIDKATHSRCGASCGYILAHLQMFNPVNYIFLKSSHVFPVDYILTLLTVLFFFLSTIIGLTFIGIRFLWIRIFSFRRNRTDPRSMLISTVLLSLAGLALNYYLAMILFPDYATFGGQLYCAPPSSSPPGTVSCENHREYLLACTEESDAKTCTPSVMSTFLNRITLNFPFFGAWAFWGAFVWLGVSLVCLVGGIVRTPSMETEDPDEMEEEEALLGN
jgi:LMBR1 domain-containing protein 1